MRSGPGYRSIEAAVKLQAIRPPMELPRLPGMQAGQGGHEGTSTHEHGAAGDWGRTVSDANGLPTPVRSTGALRARFG